MIYSFEWVIFYNVLKDSPSEIRTPLVMLFSFIVRIQTNVFLAFADFFVENQTKVAVFFVFL